MKGNLLLVSTFIASLIFSVQRNNWIFNKLCQKYIKKQVHKKYEININNSKKSMFKEIIVYNIHWFLFGRVESRKKRVL